MIADYLTKPVVGKKFFMQRDKIMNNKDCNAFFGQQDCVGKYQILR